MVLQSHPHPRLLGLALQSGPLKLVSYKFIIIIIIIIIIANIIMFFYLVITFTTRKPAKTNGITDGLHILFGKMQRRGDVEFFQTILPTE
jgi:hypothetical protein